MNSILPVVASTLMAGMGVVAAAEVAEAPSSLHWTSSWTAAPQAVWDDGFLFPSNVPPVLQDQTVRQVARLSAGGRRLRLLFSNAYGTQPLQLGRVTMALAGEGDALVPGTTRQVLFAGLPTATLAAGAPLVSDAITLPVAALARVTVSIHLPGPAPVQTFHWDGRENSWIVAGDQTSAAVLARDDAVDQLTTARLLLSGIEVDTGAPAHSIAVIGDSITDGATASLNADSRWPDALAERVAVHGVGVINGGISGGRLLSDGMGESVLARLQRDALGQPGVRTVVVMVGINDIAWPGTAFARDHAMPTLAALQAGYLQLIRQAHRQGIRVIGVTLTPFNGALPDTPLSDYYQPQKDALRLALNDWMRRSDAFDAVIDADLALRDPRDPSRLLPRFDSGDHLHPSDAGNRAIAEAVDLDALLRAGIREGAVSHPPRKD